MSGLKLKGEKAKRQRVRNLKRLKKKGAKIMQLGDMNQRQKDAIIHIVGEQAKMYAKQMLHEFGEKGQEVAEGQSMDIQLLIKVDSADIKTIMEMEDYSDEIKENERVLSVVDTDRNTGS